MGGSSGGGVPSLNSQVSDVFGSFKSQELPAFKNWFNSQPLLSQSRGAALSGLSDIPGLQAPLRDALSYLAPILASGGALTPEQNRDVTQATRSGFAARGNVTGNQSLGSELLNRDVYRQQRFGQALSEALGTTSGIQGITSQGINPALQTQQTATGTFATLLNPLFGVQDTLTNASIAQNIAGNNKSSGLLGGGLSAVGAIGGGIATAL